MRPLRLTGRYTGPIYALAVLAGITLVLYVSSTTNPTP